MRVSDLCTIRYLVQNQSLTYQDLACFFMTVLGEAGQDRDMWGIVPADDGSVRQELGRREEILCSLDTPDLQALRRSKELTADLIHGATHRLVCQ